MASTHFAPGPWMFAHEDAAIYVVRGEGAASVQRPCAHLVQSGFDRSEYFGNGVLIALAPRAVNCLRSARSLLLEQKSPADAIRALTVIEEFLNRFDRTMEFFDEIPTE